MPGFRQIGVPSSVTDPDDGARNPPIMWISVDLPAPFGPSSPVTPGPTFIDTPLTATTFPYQRDTFSRINSLMTAPPYGTYGKGPRSNRGR